MWKNDHLWQHFQCPNADVIKLKLDFLGIVCIRNHCSQGRTSACNWALFVLLTCFLAFPFLFVTSHSTSQQIWFSLCVTCTFLLLEILAQYVKHTQPSNTKVSPSHLYWGTGEQKVFLFKWLITCHNVMSVSLSKLLSFLPVFFRETIARFFLFLSEIRLIMMTNVLSALVPPCKLKWHYSDHLISTRAALLAALSWFPQWVMWICLIALSECFEIS